MYAGSSLAFILKAVLRNPNEYLFGGLDANLTARLIALITNGAMMYAMVFIAVNARHSFGVTSSEWTNIWNSITNYKFWTSNTSYSVKNLNFLIDFII